MSTLIQVMIAVVASLLAVGASYLMTRRFQKLGGGEAQERLNEIRKELDAATTEKLRLLGEQFTACKVRLVQVEAQLKRMSDERRDLRQDVSDLHDEIRDLRGARKVNQDARDVRQEGRATRQDKRQIRQDSTATRQDTREVQQDIREKQQDEVAVDDG